MPPAKKPDSFWFNVSNVQQKLSAPKDQDNKFGGYRYRSAESILEAVKPLLGELVLTISDSVEIVGDRFYVKATASITDGTHTISNSAFAREALTKKGMDESMITGSASSYARKYALNGLLCIDDATRDPDSNEASEERDNTDQEAMGDLIEKINGSNSTEDLLAVRAEIKPSPGEQPSTEDQLWYAGLSAAKQKKVEKAFKERWTQVSEAKA